MMDTLYPNGSSLKRFSWTRKKQKNTVLTKNARSFAKLGYTASTILHHIEDYEDLLKVTKSNNLVQACRIYLEQCDFIIVGLKVLSWFTYKVTLPFLNMVELSSQHDLLKTLPQLYDDLSNKCIDTLSMYQVDYSFGAYIFSRKVYTCTWSCMC